MRKFVAGSLIATLAAFPVVAQPVNGQAPENVKPLHPSMQSSSKPIDHGPFTSQANAAYQGGGMVLEGAPGGPPPGAQPTPPGQMPSHMVPQ